MNNTKITHEGIGKQLRTIYTKQAKSVTHFMFTHFKPRLNINEVCYGQTSCAYEK